MNTRIILIEIPFNSLSLLNRIEHNHEFNWSNVLIFNEEKCFNKRLISEVIFIKNKKKRSSKWYRFIEPLVLWFDHEGLMFLCLLNLCIYLYLYFIYLFAFLIFRWSSLISITFLTHLPSAMFKHFNWHSYFQKIHQSIWKKLWVNFKVCRIKIVFDWNFIIIFMKKILEFNE